MARAERARLLFTFTITGLWRATSYQRHDLWTADAFLILFFLMYVAVSILNCVRQPPNLKGYVSGSLVFGLPVVAFTLHATMISRIEYGLAWSAFALGAFYLLLGWTLFATRRDTFRLLVEAFAALGVIFASLAIPWHSTRARRLRCGRSKAQDCCGSACGRSGSCRACSARCCRQAPVSDT